MRRLLTPFSLYWLSLTDVYAYPRLMEWPTKIKIFVLLVVFGLLALASTLHFSLQVLPRWQNNWQEIWENTKKDWPDALTIRYQDGKLAVSPDEPLAVSYPSSFSRPTGWPMYFARIDARETPEHKTDSFLFFTREELKTRAATTETQSIRLNEVFGEATWSVDKETVLNSDDKVNQFFQEISTALTGGWFAFHWLGKLISRLLGLILYAWITQGIFSLMGTKLSYKQSYSLGMIALLPAETLQTMVEIVYDKPLPLFWWSWLGIMFLVGWLNRRRF